MVRILANGNNLTFITQVILLCIISIVSPIGNSLYGQCNTTFYDTGGSSGNYSNNQNYTETFTAPAGSTLNIDFISFNLENGYDKLYVYDGPNTGSTLIATLTGSATPNDITSSGREITFKFTSDYSVVKSGWQIEITCNTVLDCSNIPTLDFQNPTLTSGTFGSVGSKYLFSNVLAGIADAVLTIVAKSHSDIVITNIDAPRSTHGGYDESFQPIIDYDWKNSNGSNDATGDKYVTFTVEFFSAGTNTLVTVPQLAVTGIDIDGDSEPYGVREFLRSSGYQSYSLQSTNQLTLTGSLKALGPVTNYELIDESALDVMLSFNYSGVNSVTFDYGGTYSGASSYADERYNSLFFKCYGFDQTVCQPVNAPTGISNSRCGTGPVALSSSGCNGTVKWYTSANGGTSLHDGTNFITPVLSSTKIYYIECYDVGCVSDLRSQVTATINTDCAEICDNGIDDDGDGDIDCDDLDCGQILNREFDEGTVNWFLYNQTGNSSLFKIDNTSQLSGINSAYIDISTINGSTDWHTQFGSGGISIENGKTYGIYFQAKATSNKSISVSLQLDYSPWTSYLYNSVNVTTTTQSFYYEFTANSTVSDDINLLFNIGASTADIWIDNVQFKEVCNLSEICDNGIDDDGDGLIDCNDPDCSSYANAGADKSQCENGAFEMIASTLAAGQIGEWTKVSGTAYAHTQTYNDTCVWSVPAGSTATLRWTVTNGSCSTFDDVVITNTTGCSTGCVNPINNNGDLELEGTATNFNLSLNTTPAVLIDDNFAPLGWAERYGGNTTSLANFQGAFYVKKTGSNGDPKSGSHMIYLKGNGFCLSSLTTQSNIACGKTYQIGVWVAAYSYNTTQGNAPFAMEFHSSGSSNSQVLTSNFDLIAPASNSWNDLNWQRYTMTVTIPSSGYEWADFFFTSLSDNHGIVIDDLCITEISTGSEAIGGPDQFSCSNTLTLNANTPPAGYTGSWSVVSGSASFTNASSPTSNVTITSGTSALLHWTINNGSGCSTFDEVVVGYNNGTSAISVNNETVCPNTPVTLTATGCSGTLLWSTGETTSSITVNPSTTTSYSVSCTGSQGSNLVQNAGFESSTNFQYWNNWDNAGITTTGSDLRTGNKTAKISALDEWGGFGQDFAATPGSLYTISAWVRTTNTNPLGMMAVTFINNSSSWTTISELSTVKITSTEWTKYTLQLVSPPNTTHMQVSFESGEGANLFVDDVSVTSSTECMVSATGTVSMASNCIEICDNGIDDDGDGLIDGADPDCGSNCPLGTVTLERWLGITGTEISGLTSSPNYPNSPSETAILTSLDVPDDIADNFGTRIRGYIVPSITGNYIFNLTSDDEGAFYLSSNGNPSNMALTSSVSGWTGALDYTKYASQTSSTIYLESGVNYYFEILHKEGTGGDNLQVSWKTPSNSSFNIVPGGNLRPFICSAEICDNGIDDDGDGLIDCEDTDCTPSGNADVVVSQSGVTNPNNALGVADGAQAQLWDSGDQIVLDLTEELPTGNLYTIRWRRDPGTNEDPNIRVEESANGSSWSTAAGSPFTFTTTTYFDQTIRTGTTTRYLRFTTQNAYNVDLDAVSYTLNCGDEICGNGIDDDGNGLIDENDPIINDTLLICNGNTAPTTIDLLDAPIEYTWTIINQPSGGTATVNGNSGLITNINKSGQYILSLTNGVCGDTIEVVVPNCDLPCFCDGSTSAGYADWSNLSMTTQAGPYSDTFTVPIPGHTSMQVTRTLTSGGKSNRTNNNFTNPNRLAFQTLGYTVGPNQPIYVETSGNQTQNVTFNFDSPVGNIDLLLFDIDESDIVNVSAEDYAGNTITNLSGWIVRGTGDATTYAENNGSENVFAPSPTFNSTTGTITSSNASNFNRSFIALRPNIRVKKIFIAFTSAIGGNHIYADIYGTFSGVACPNPAVTLSGTNTICNGSSTTLSAAGSGGSGSGYTYSWSNGLGTGATKTVSPTTNTTYTVTVTDVNGCTATASRAVTVNGNPTASISGTNTICSGKNSTFTASGGGTYLWSTSATTASISVSTAGTYRVTVTNASGCTATASRTLTVNASPTASISGTSTICAGVNSTFTASGGGTYLWSTSATTSSINVSTAGTYTVTVTNTNGCTATASRTLTVNANPTASISGTSTICAGGNSTFTASGGGTYLWSTSATTSSINISTAGTYTVTVTNANGCTATASRTLTVNANPTASISGTNTICAGVNSTFTASGGGTYLWNTSATTSSINVSTAGTYIVTVTNANGCTATASRTLTVNANPTASISGTSTICAGGNSTFTASGGGTYLWSTSATTSSINVSTAGTYTVTVTNANGCTATASRTLTVNANPTASISGTNTICAGGNSTFTASGGTYLWSTSATTSSINVSTAGTYTVTVTNASGCTATASRTLTVNTNPTASISGMNTICAGGSSIFTASGGGTYLWSTSATTSSINVSTAGTYTVTVTNASGCTATASRTLTVTANPIVSISGDSTGCSQVPIVLTANVSDGGNSITYFWSNGASGSSTTVSPIDDSTFYLTVLSSTGCEAITSHKISIIKESVVLSATASSDTICEGVATVLTVNETSAKGGLIDYSTWTEGSGSAPGFSVNGSNTENFRVQGTDPWGKQTVVWEARPDAVSGPDGGWNSSNIDIDHTKTYRISTWVNRRVAGMDGRLFLGMNGFGSVNGVKTRSNGTVSTNPYFYITPNSTSLPEDEWVLIVGHVFASTDTGTTNHPESGRYTVSDGYIGDISTEYQWLPESTTARHRSYLYYGIDTSVRQQWAYPRFDVIDGTEPSVQDLLNGFDSNGGLGGGSTWEWFTGSCGGNLVGTGPSISVSPSETTTYYVRGSNICGTTLCKNVTVVYKVLDPGSIDYNGSTCLQSNSELTANINGGTNPLMYSWTGPNSFTGNKQTIDITEHGKYNVTVTDSKGCTTTATGIVNVEFKPTIITLGADVCEGDSVNLSVESPTAISYQWSSNASNQTTKVATVFPTPPTNLYKVTVTNSSGCSAVPEIIINSTPRPTLNLSGPSEICIGETTKLNASAAGNWTPLNSSVAVVNSSGLVTGLSEGKARFIFTQASNSCQSDTSVVIKVHGKTPVSLIGPSTICIASTTQVSPNSGGTWTSSNNSVATINNSGLITGVGQGTAYFVFKNDTTGCNSNPSTSITIEKGNAATLSGPSSTCVGKSITLSASPNGGTWVSEDLSIATVNANSGLVTPISEGFVTIRYDHNSGSCSLEATKTIQIREIPKFTYVAEDVSCSSNDGVISFTIMDHPTRTHFKLSIDDGASFTTIADNIGTYDFEDLIPGIYIIKAKWDNNECEIDAGQVEIVDDNPSPSTIISSTNEPCGSTQGGSITFQITDIPGKSEVNISLDGGTTWPHTVNDNVGTYVINNVSPGTYHIATRWSDNTCSKQKETITIFGGHTNLGTISPNDTICFGDSKLINAGGGVSYEWSNNQSGSSIFVSPTSTTSYSVTVTQDNGCISVKNTTVMVVRQLSLNLDFNGGLCLTDTSTIQAIHTGGLAPFEYLWAGPNGPAGSTKIININEGGNYYLTITDDNGCQANASGFIYQKYEPIIINLQSKVCEGASVNLDLNAPDAISYLWSNNAGKATTKNVTVIPQIPSSTYQVSVTNNLGCVAVASAMINVDAAPVVSLSGADSICIGATTALSPSNNGFWASTNQSVAQVNSSGVVIGLSAGSSDFYYTENVNYCSSLDPITIKVLSNEIGGFVENEICEGDTIYLSPNTGGVWSTKKNEIFSVTPSGMVIGLSEGQGKFDFTMDGSGCIATTYGEMVVNAKPKTSYKDGTDLCLGLTTEISPFIGGTWTSTDPSIASIDNKGLITGLSIGTANFIYKSDETGCVSNPSTTLNVTNRPVPIVDGPDEICAGSSTQLLPNTGGVWQSTNSSIATITSSGVINGVYPGTARFIFISDGGLCISDTSQIITVFEKPTTTLNGPSNLCVGETTSFSPTVGGIWSSSNNTIATITNSGVVTAIGPGIATFTFENSTTGCRSNASSSIVVYARPKAILTGVDSICVGSTTTLSPTSGGVWTSSNNAIANISSSGIVTGLSAGSATFVFKENQNDCVSPSSVPIEILPRPSATITGPTTICAGSTTTLSPTSGGYWISSNSAIASVSESGVVLGVSQGLVKFTFVSDFGCSSAQTAPIIVNGKPVPIFAKTPTICIGKTINIIPSSGGAWSSSDNQIATITKDGLITAISAGSATFVFTDTLTGCTSSQSASLVVNSNPVINVPAGSKLCVGATMSVAPTSGGIWQSSNQLVASVSNNGVITGLTAGTTTLQYQSISTGCLSDASSTVTVNPKPIIVLNGPASICEGDSTFFTPSIGGTWTSNNPEIASITNAGKVVGVTGGITRFRFKSTALCSSDLSTPISINSATVVGLLGEQFICISGSTNVFPTVGGTWTSSDPSIATVTNSGVVSGLKEGVVYLTYTDALTGCESDGNLQVNVMASPIISLIGDSEICMGYTTKVASSSSGIWVTSDARIATVNSDGTVNGIAPGVVTISFTDLLTGCKNSDLDIEIVVSKCLNNDFNVTLLNIPVSGDLSTNDITPVGSLYNDFEILKSKPSGSIYTLNINSDGTYDFTANKAGKYIFEIQICKPPADFGCPVTILEVTVLGDVLQAKSPVINLEFSTTFASDDMALEGEEVEVNAMQNDMCLFTSGCTLSTNDLSIVTAPTKGIDQILTDGWMSYIPQAGFIGTDIISYNVCTDNSQASCATSSTYITVNSPSAYNSVVAPDDFNYTFSGTPVTGNVKSNDSDPEGDELSVVPNGSEVSPIAIVGGSYFIDSEGDYTFSPDDSFSGPTSFVYIICDDNDEVVCMNATVHFIVIGDIKVTVKVYLEGALINNGAAKSASGKPLMRDDLRVSPFDGKNYIPIYDPYTSGVGLLNNSIKSHVASGLLEKNRVIIDSAAVFSVEGENAIVDWVYLELRAKNDMSQAIATRSALVQRDGDVVDLDGVSPVRFTNVGVDSFYLIISHRSHLGVMSGLVSHHDFIDFTSVNTETFNFGYYPDNGYDYTGLTFNTNVVNGYNALWAGDMNSNGIIGFIGGDDDVNTVITEVLLFDRNTEFKANYDFAYGYFNGDFDMNSKVKYTNPNDDTNMLFTQLLLYTLNNTFASNFAAMLQQIPKRKD